MFRTASALTVSTKTAGFRKGSNTPLSIMPDLLNVGSSPVALDRYIGFFLNEIAKNEGETGKNVP